MSAESSGPQYWSAPPQVALRNAYVQFFQGIYEDNGAIGLVSEAASSIRDGGAPYAHHAINCAVSYRQFWFARNDGIGDAFALFEGEHPADRILAPIVKSFAFSELAMDGISVVRAAMFLDKGRGWLRSQIREAIWDYDEAPKTLHDLDADRVRSLGGFAVQAIRASTRLVRREGIV